MTTDTESRFISALLRATIVEQDQFFTQQLPLGVFKSRQPEMLWLTRYREKHGRYPSVILAQQHFREKFPKVKDPVTACIQPILDMSAYDEMRKVQNATKKLIEEGKIQEAMDVYRKGASTLTSYSVDYSDSNMSDTKAPLARYRDNVHFMHVRPDLVIDTPWPTINKRIHRFKPGNMVTVASRSSVGKTWLILYWAHYLARKGIRTLVVSKEMPTEEVEERLECIEFKLDFDQFLAGELPAKELKRWRQARKDKIKLDLIVTGEETLEGTGIGHVHRKIEQYKPTVYFLDGAYLLTTHELARNSSNPDRMTYLSSRLKSLCKFTKTVGIQVVQMNRESEDKQGNSKGSFVGVYGSDSWGQNSDGLLGISGKRGATFREIEILKGRNSKLGAVQIAFQINPYPDFAESNVPHHDPKNTQSVEFKGI
jgi:replicative DNA helicase